MSSTPKLSVIRGLPGSGKTTLAMILEGTRGSVRVEADDFLYDESGKYVWTPERSVRAHELCRQRVRELLEQGCDVVVSGVFCRVADMQEYLDLQARYPGDVYECQSEFANIHQVPDEKMERFAREWEPYERSTFHVKSSISSDWVPVQPIRIPGMRQQFHPPSNAVSYGVGDHPPAFIDDGVRLEATSSCPATEEIRAMLRVAAVKWGGVLRISGPEAFQRAVRVAADEMELGARIQFIAVAGATPAPEPHRLRVR